jgi:fucose permease
MPFNFYGKGRLKSMEKSIYKVYPYRWVILAVFMVVVAINQVMWITFASITSIAADYYHVSDLSIGLLSMIFMIVYIVISIPASWIIDSYGIRVGVGIGAILTGAFGIMRGYYASSYNMVLIAQIGIAIGQPFILNVQQHQVWALFLPTLGSLPA